MTKRNTISDETAEQILDMVDTQPFADWYESDLMDYIEGAEDRKSKEEILEDIKRLMK